MMKKTLILSVIFYFIYSSTIFAQQIIEGHYGKQGLDAAYSVAATNDGGYIITGLTMSEADSNGEIVVIKTTAHGDTSWSHIYGGPLLTGGNCVIQTSDGGYMVSGHTQDWGAHDCDFYLMKLDPSGNMLWEKTYGGDSDDVSKSVVELSGGGYVMGGFTISYGNVFPSQNRHVYFIKTNSVGDMVWKKLYAGSNNEECASITSTSDGGFLAVGWSNSWGNGEDDGWLLRLNSNGDTLWTKFYKNAGDTRLSKILHTMDNGYIVTGYTTPLPGGLSQGLVIKLDANGDQLWQKTYNDSVNIIFQDVAQLPTGNYLFAGSNYVTPTTRYVYVMTTDVNGVMISDESYGGVNSFAYAIAAQGNNSYLVVGSAAKYGDPDGDLYFMEMDNTVSTNIATLHSGWPRLFPNPVREQPAIIILPASEANQSVHFEVMTTDGQIVLSNDNILAKNIIIDRNNFRPALYLFRITCPDGEVYKGKFVVE